MQHQRLDHDIRKGERHAYPLGRQPFSYGAIIVWAKANGYPYEFRRGPAVKLGLFVYWLHRWTYFRGV